MFTTQEERDNAQQSLDKLEALKRPRMREYFG